MLKLAVFFCMIFPAICFAENRKFIIADFDSGKKPSNLGGDFGSWDNDPGDKTHTCVDSFARSIRRGPGGYSLRVIYDVASSNPAFNGVWFKLNNADFTPFTKLVLWVKGDKIRGFTKVFKLELKNARGEKGAYYVSGISEEWTKIEIPLRRFGLKDYSQMDELVIVFEDNKVTEKEGVIYIDDIYLE